MKLSFAPNIGGILPNIFAPRRAARGRAPVMLVMVLVGGSGGGGDGGGRYCKKAKPVAGKLLNVNAVTRFFFAAARRNITHTTS